MNAHGGWIYLVAAATVGLAAAPSMAAGSPKAMRITKVADRPTARHPAAAARAISKLRDHVASKPRDRKARFALVQALVQSGDLQAALREARQWRQRDAYNLLVVRMLGDIQAQLGERDAALRTWSAVVELLPDDASAHRALASALKQAGETKAACARLRRAVELRKDDARLRFEWAVCQQRVGRHEQARKLFEGILADDKAPRLVLGPAKQRLAQLYGRRQAAASANARDEDAQTWRAKRSALRVPGGTSSAIKVYLGWDTDRSDIDLWVTTPSGERVWYRHKHGKHGGALFGDVTTGYGPEMFTIGRAQSGTYKVAVNYFGTSRRGLREARGEVIIVTNEGRADEQRKVLPYRLFEPGQTVEVARITTNGGHR